MSRWLANLGRAVMVGVAIGIVAAVSVGLVASSRTARAATTDVGTTTVRFNIAEAIEVTSWPAAAFTLSSNATPGVPVVSGTLSIGVKSNAPWGIQVVSDSENGQLREFDLSVGAYVFDGRTTSPLEWALDPGGPWTAISSTPTTMFTNQPPTGEDGATVGFVLRVTPSFDHEPLPAGREYRIVLTYTAGVGF